MTDKPRPPRTIDREIEDQIATVSDDLLKGRAHTYEDYARLTARYAVLRELKEFLREQRQHGDESDEV